MKRYRSATEAAEYLGISKQMFYRREPQPEAEVIVGKAKGYTDEVLDAWHASFQHTPNEQARPIIDVPMERTLAEKIKDQAQTAGARGTSTYLVSVLEDARKSIDPATVEDPAITDEVSVRIYPPEGLKDALIELGETHGLSLRKTVRRLILAAEDGS